MADDRAELRRLLAGWRNFKQRAVPWVLRVALAMLLIGWAVRLRLEGLIS